MEQKKQHGFALPVAVFALVVVGIITTGGFFMARQEGRIGVASEYAGLAFYLTEQGLVDRMGRWNPTVFGALPFWGDTTITENYRQKPHFFSPELFFGRDRLRGGQLERFVRWHSNTYSHIHYR